MPETAETDTAENPYHRPFAGLTYIGRDGLERFAPDIAAVAALVRGGDVTCSTFVRNAPDEAWRRAETDATVAALLTLAGSGPRRTASGIKPKGKAIGLTGMKVAFLLLMFLIAAAIGGVAGELNSREFAHTFGYYPARTSISFPTALFVFLPTILAVRDRHFAFGGKAKRFLLSMLWVSAALTAVPVISLLLFNLFPPPDLWSIVGIWLVLGIGQWLIALYGLKRLWSLPSFTSPLLFFRPWENHPQPISKIAALILVSLFFTVTAAFIFRPDLHFINLLGFMSCCLLVAVSSLTYWAFFIPVGAEKRSSSGRH